MFLLSEFSVLCVMCFSEQKKRGIKHVLIVFLVLFIFQNKKKFSKPVHKQVLYFYFFKAWSSLETFFSCFEDAFFF